MEAVLACSSWHYIGGLCPKVTYDIMSLVLDDDIMINPDANITSVAGL